MAPACQIAIALSLLAIGGPTPAAGPSLYEAIDRHALKAPPEAEESLPKLANYLGRACTTDREKARAIYRWITDRVAYDAESFFSGRQPDGKPDAVLRTRKAVCEGYANLFVDLSKRMGVQAVKVGGYAKIVGYVSGQSFPKPNHAWNAVHFENKWWLIDATWGAGHVERKQHVKRFTGYYFLVPPERLAFTHLPADDRWQLAKPLLTLKQFEQQAIVDRRLFELGVSVESVRATINDPACRGLVQPYVLPGSRTFIVKAPLQKHLKAGQRYEFEFTSDDFVEIAIFSNGKRGVTLRRTGTTFSGAPLAFKGPFMIAGKAKRTDRRYAWILGYVGE
jgi:hypothetical protein